MKYYMIKVFNTCTAFLNEFHYVQKEWVRPGVWSSIGAWHVGVVIMVPETISKKLRPMVSYRTTQNMTSVQCVL